MLAFVRLSEDDLDLAGSLGGVLLDVSISLRGRPACNELQIVGTRATALANLFHCYAVVESGRGSCAGSTRRRSGVAIRPYRPRRRWPPRD